LPAEKVGDVDEDGAGFPRELKSKA
jgi:hypothetical protein